MNEQRDPIVSAVQDLTRRHVEWVDAQLSTLPVGATLCVHELPSDWASDTYTVRTEAHTLTAGGTCDAGVRRIQYGPMTEEIAEIAREMGKR